MSLNGGIWLWIGSNGRNIPYHINMDVIVTKLNFVFSSSELDNKRPIQRNATTDSLRKIYSAFEYQIDDMDACIHLDMCNGYFGGGDGTELRDVYKRALI